MFFLSFIVFFFFKQKTAYEMRISDWSSDVCSSDLFDGRLGLERVAQAKRGVEFRPSARDRKPIDLAHILFEAACDVESAARFDQPDHVQYLWRVDFHDRALADDGESIAFESIDDAKSMGRVEPFNAVRVPCAGNLLESFES